MLFVILSLYILMYHSTSYLLERERKIILLFFFKLKAKHEKNYNCLHVNSLCVWFVSQYIGRLMRLASLWQSLLQNSTRDSSSFAVSPLLRVLHFWPCLRSSPRHGDKCCTFNDLVYLRGDSVTQFAGSPSDLLRHGFDVGGLPGDAAVAAWHLIS